MEYSIKEVRDITKNTLLSKPENQDLYEDIYKYIYIAAQSNATHLRYTYTDHTDSYIIDDVIDILKLEGYEVQKEDEISIYISWS